MALKKIGYYISKGRCVRAYLLTKKDKRGKKVTKKVNYLGKPIKKGTKIYKTKAQCKKVIVKKAQIKAQKAKVRAKKEQLKARKTKSRTSVISKRSKFGEKHQCAYALPYFGDMVPSVSKTWSGTPSTVLSSSAWMWPTPPSAKVIDGQQGNWLKVKNIVNN